MASDESMPHCGGRREAADKTAVPSSSSTNKAGTSRACSTLSRAIPTIVEIQQRINIDEYPGFQNFYLHALPLIKGTNVEIFRRCSQRYELRQIVLSSDFQRVEVWSPSAVSSSSSASAGAVPSARNRPRLPESFFRLESLSRIHVPKGTLVAVQRAIQSATSPTTSDINLDMFSSEVSQAVNDWTRAAGVHRAPDATGGDGSAGVSPRDSARSGGTNGSGASRQAFYFDLVMICSEPWRLMVTDVHSFHVATQAIGSLLTSRASLSAYAIVLGLGATSTQWQA